MRETMLLLLAFAGMSLSSFAQGGEAKVTISVSNPTNINRTDEVVAVSWASVKSKYPKIDTANFKVLNAATKAEVPFQLERRGGNDIKNLLVQLSLKANGSHKLMIVTGKPSVFQPKTYGRYVPERYDDFAWENDKVAFRMYGKALESRKDNAFGIDVWVKRSTKLVINEWYKSGDYHADHGDGMDYYSVGFTLGAGDIAPYIKDSIMFSKNYHHWKVLDNGPLRTTFELGYDEWNVGDRAVKAKKVISLDAGSRMNRIEVTYSFKGDQELPVVAGIVKRKEPGTLLLDEKQGIAGYWEPKHGADGTTGVAVVLTDGNVKMGTDKLHLLASTVAKNDQPVIYYNGAAWDKANEITTAGQWFEYLNDFKTKLSQPLTVTVQ